MCQSDLRRGLIFSLGSVSRKLICELTQSIIIKGQHVYIGRNGLLESQASCLSVVVSLFLYLLLINFK